MSSQNVRGFLIQHGLIQPHDAPSSSGEFRIECPDCKNPKNKCFVNALGKGVSCKHCPFRASWRGFQRRYEPPSPEEVALEQFVTESQNRLHADTALMQYLRDRGFTDQTIKDMRFGYFDKQVNLAPSSVFVGLGLFIEQAPAPGATGPTGWWLLQDRLIIPYMRDRIVTEVRGRINPLMTYSNDPPKYLQRSGAEKMIYHTGAIDPKLPVTLTEGEFDAALLRQFGEQSIGVPGAETADPKAFKEYAHLLIAFDGDEAGRKGADAVIHKVPEIRQVALPEGFDCSEYIGAFGYPSYESLKNSAQLFIQGQPQKDDTLSTVVQNFYDWAWANGPLLGARILWAPRLEQTLSGWAPGLILVGAEANSGKSCFNVKAVYQCAVENPDDTIAVLLSLDDTVEETMQRLVALHSGMHFEYIRSPRWYFDHPTDPTRRNPARLAHLNKSIEEIAQMQNLIIRDASYGRSLGYVRTFIQQLRAKFPDKRIVMIIDSLVKITPDPKDPNTPKGGGDDEAESTSMGGWKGYLARELKYLANIHRICMVTPVDLRKMNDNRRPTRDDLKDCVELAYEANAILLCYNEINRLGNMASPSMKWSTPSGEEHPLYEMIVNKNKFTTHKPTIRYEFYGPMSDFCERTAAMDHATMGALIQEAQLRKGKGKTP